MKKIYLFILFCLGISFANAQQVFLTENFNFATDSLLQRNGWYSHSNGTTNPIKATNGGLSLTKTVYPGNGIGNAAAVSNTGSDENKPFSSYPNSGNVYASFLVRVNKVSPGYFFHLGEYSTPTSPTFTALSTNFRARTSVDTGSTKSKFKLGLAFNANIASGLTGDLDTGVTYLVVVKYKFVSGASNDSVSMFVFADGSDISAEPAKPTLGPYAGTAIDMTNAQAVVLRQYSATQNIVVDGIIAQSTWNFATTPVASTQIGPISVPKFAVATKGSAADSVRAPIVFRLRINGLKPNEKYQYITKVSDSFDLKMRSTSTGGAGNMIGFNTSGNFKYITSPTMGTAGKNDTFESNMMGEFEGWFGVVTTTDRRFNAGKTVFPLVIAVGSTSKDTLIGYCGDAIKMLDYGTTSSGSTLVWGSSQASAKSFVSLYEATSSSGLRPLSIGMVEGSGIGSNWSSNTPWTIKNKVIGTTGNWSAVIPNNLAGGLRRVENVNLSNGFLVYANSDADGTWGPSKKSTVNSKGGIIYLDNDDAALVPTKVEFWARTSTAKEDVGKYNVFVTRKFSDEKDQTVRFFVAGGTAVKGATADYTVTERTITFKGAGAASSDTSVITINDDNAAEGAETIVLGIDQASNCVIGTEKAHTISITDNDVANIELPKTLIVVKENAGKIGVVIKMDKPVANASKMMLMVKMKGDSTYIPSEFQLGKSGKDSTFNLGLSTKADSLMIFAKVNDDFNIEPNDTVVLVLRQLTGNAFMKDSIITLVMTDNDGPATIEFIDSKLTVVENVGNVAVRIRVKSRSDADADFTLRCYTALSTATEGVDFKFNPTSKIINITSSTADTIVVNVPFYDDKNFELTKKVYFGLGNLSNTKITKNKDTLIITLLNDDLPIYTIGKINKQTNATKTADSLNVRCRVYGTVHGVNLRTVGMNFTFMDGTGGMGVYTSPKTFGYTVAEGDSIMVQGTVSQFQGTVQMDKLDTIIKISSAQPLKKAKVVNGVDETTESVLVQMRRVKMVDAAEWPSAALAANGFKYVRVMNTSGRVDTLNIDAETNIDGSTAPVGYFDVTGIGAQFDNTSPFTSRYVLTPRSIDDIKASALPTVNFAKTKDSIFEPADSFRIDFSVIPADENFSFDVAIAGGTAVSPTDYDFATRKINVVKNVSSFLIRANITDDGDPDGDKILIFAIRNAQGPCFIGKDSLLTLKIKDNEASVVKRFAEGSIKMYPNPTNGMVQINSVENMKSVKVYTLSGQLVRSIDMTDLSKLNAITMELNAVSGLYRVQVITASGNMYSDFLSVQ